MFWRRWILAKTQAVEDEARNSIVEQTTARADDAIRAANERMRIYAVQAQVVKRNLQPLPPPTNVE